MLGHPESEQPKRLAQAPRVAQTPWRGEQARDSFSFFTQQAIMGTA
jgi:hypothetical protein